MNDLNLFFEYEKNDSICEFRINYNNFKKVRKITIEDLLYLQKLYKEFQKELIVEIKKLDDTFQIEQLAEQITKINLIYDYLQKEIIKKKTMYKKKKKKEHHENIVAHQIHPEKIENNFKKIEKEELIDLTDKNVLLKYPLDSILISVSKLIKKSKITDELINILKDLSEYLNQKVNDRENLPDEVYLVSDAIKNRIAHESKDNREQREKLKQIKILFDSVINNDKEKKYSIKHDYLFDIVDFFLTNEKYYLYLQKLLEEIPRTVNIRYLNDEKESEHIIFYILDTFISNYEKMLFDKKSHYINKDYLKAIYLLFTQNYLIYLTQEEKKKIDLKLSTFMGNVNSKLTSSKRQNAVKDDLRIMYSDKFFMYRKALVQRDVDIYKLDWQMNSILYNFNSSLKDSSRIDLTNDDLIIFENGFHAYSLEKIEDSSYKLKIHVVDLYNVIVEYTQLDNEIFNNTLKGEKIDSFIINVVEMREMKEVPTITYEVPIDENRNFIKENIKIYPSKVKIENLTTEVNEEMLGIFKNNNKDFNKQITNSDIDKFFESVLNECITYYVMKNDLPFIYSGIKNKKEKEFDEIMNQIGYFLIKLDREEFNKIYNIVDSEIDRFHYSTYPFDGKYELSIINPMNYFGILNQRFLYEMVIFNKHNPDEYNKAIKDYKKKYDDLVAIFNYYNNYVDSDVLESNLGRLKKIKKILF